MNKTIKLLMLSDIFVLTGFGLIDPILAIFVKENLQGGTIFAAGIATALFIITKCIVQLPFSRYVDKNNNKIKWLIAGTFMTALVPFIYIFSKNIVYIYIAQVIHGIGSGLAYPTWLGLWSINLDKKQESFEWSLYSTLTGIGTAFTAAIGAAIAEFIGFVYSFLLVSFLAIIGASILFALETKKKGLEKITLQHYNKQRKLNDYTLHPKN